MARVFISHASRDNPKAAELKVWLDAAGFEQTFLDIDEESGIPPGADWERKLYGEIERSQAMILVLTPHWFASKWCFAEFTQARALGKAIFPLIVTPGGDTLVAPDVQHLDLTKDRAGGLDKLRRELTRVALDAQGGFEFPTGRAPYPGLPSFEAADAAVYFGRDDDIRRAIERLNARRVQGGAKLLAILGASGAGKSSLLKAGVLPRLARDPLTWVPLPPVRPGADPMRALRNACRARAPDADPAALTTPDEALDLVDRLRGAGSQATVLIAIDQGEELFTRATPQARAAFLRALTLMTAGDAPALVVMTLRADHLGDLQAAGGPGFEAFALAPVPLDRIGAIVQGPARVAGLEVDEALPAAMMRDAESAEALPLVAFALRRLWDQRGARGRLDAAAYEALRDGALTPLDVIVREAADAALAAATPTDEERAALREAFVPALVKVDVAGAYVRQGARFEALPPAAHRLLRALADQRLLVLGGEGGGTVEVAHEALFRVWPLLAGWLAEEREFLVGKGRIEAACREWAAMPADARPRGLLAGLLLDRAKDWLARHPGRFPEDEAGFIRASADAADAEAAQREAEREKARAAELAAAEAKADAARQVARRTRIGLIAASVLAVMAVAGGFVAWERGREAVAQRTIAEERRAEAERNFDVAREAVDQVIFQFAAGFRDTEGVRGEVIEQLLTQTRGALDRLTAAEPDDLRVQRSRAAMLMQFGDVRSRAGDSSAAREAYVESLGIARRIAASDLRNGTWRRDVFVALNKLGDLDRAAGDVAAARAAYAESLDLRNQLTASDLSDVVWQRDILGTLNRLGDLDRDAGDIAAARAAYAESLELARRLAVSDPRNVIWQSDISANLQRLGDLDHDAGDVVAARAAYTESLDIRRRLVVSNPRNVTWRRDVSVSLEKLGDLDYAAGDVAAARAAYAEGLDIRRRLAASDPRNVTWQRDVGVSLERLGDLDYAAGDVPAARMAYVASLDIARRLAALDPRNVQWQRDVGVSLERLGDLDREAGNFAAARAAYAESLEITRRLAATGSRNVQRQRDLVIALQRVAWVAATDDERRSAWREARDIMRRLETAGHLSADDRELLDEAMRRLAELGVTD
jgi:tetratricopeptide (TPR) repeat protein